MALPVLVFIQMKGLCLVAFKSIKPELPNDGNIKVCVIPRLFETSSVSEHITDFLSFYWRSSVVVLDQNHMELFHNEN